MDRMESLKERVAIASSSSKEIRDFMSEILDEKSFVETNAFFFDQGTFADVKTAGEGVVTGYGTVDGIPLYIYGQNSEMLKGGMSKGQSEKILKLLELAEKTSTPVLAILDSMGAKVGEGMEALAAYGKIIKKVTTLSGNILQIAIVKGNATGHMAYLASLCDVVYAVDGGIISGGNPSVVLAKSEIAKPAKEILGASFAEKNGYSNKTLKKDEIKNEISKLLDLILTEGDEDEEILGDTSITASATNREILEKIADEGSVLELSQGYLPNLFTSIARISGTTVAVIGTEGGELDGAMAKKAARFVNFAECFNMPIVTLVDSVGQKADLKEEEDRGAASIASLLYSISASSVAKIAVITKNAVGVSFSAFASKDLGFDYTFAFATANLSPLPVKAGATIVYGDLIKNSKDPLKTREEIEEKYLQIESDPFNSAKLGTVDNIIDPSMLRPHLVAILSSFIYKDDDTKILGNHPL